MLNPRVLLVEDNLLLRWWMLSSLMQEGFWVIAPPTVEEALSMAAGQPFDILITDWRLPGNHDGFEILALAKQNNPQLLSVLMSAEADGEAVQHAQAAGFDQVLAKPFNVEEILDAVRNLGQQDALQEAAS